ncbi:MAG: putative toxin-antitoxin system toxin component, PIN family [Polaromonas sp.]|nr:putative toxin-antitoxin system toxin component, PIN family [Polaromonas sp.]
MRVVLDTNVLVSALLVNLSAPAQLLTAWRRGAFELLTCDLQLQEIRAVTRRDSLRALIRPALAGELVNQLRGMAVWLETLPRVDRSPDPFDNFLLAMAEGGQADVLVSGDKRGVLALKSHGPCRIVTVRQFVLELGPT